MLDSLCALNDELVLALRGAVQSLTLIDIGLKNGSVKAKPVLSLDAGETAMSLPMRSLDEIVETDLRNCRAVLAKASK